MVKAHKTTCRVGDSEPDVESVGLVVKETGEGEHQVVHERAELAGGIVMVLSRELVSVSLQTDIAGEGVEACEGGAVSATDCPATAARRAAIQPVLA